MTSWHPLLFLLAFAHQSNAGKTCPDKNWKIDSRIETCFRVTRGWRTWWQSRSACLELGGDLAFIDSRETLQFVEGLIKPQRLKAIWVGATRYENGTLKWINGHPLRYTNWPPREPSEESDDRCVLVWKYDLKWTLSGW